MGIRTSSLTLITKGTAAKLALGAASLMMVTVIGSATIAGATPLEDSIRDKNTTSLEKNREKNNKENDNNDKNQRDKEHHENQRDKKHHKNNGNHGYGGGNGNAINTDLTINQSGNNNVLSVVYNFFFG